MRRKLLLACGPLSSLLYVVAIDVIAPLRHRRYHQYSSQMVSELFAVRAPTRGLLFWLSIPYHVLVFAFVAGVWLSAGRSRRLRLVAGGLGGYGVLSAAGLIAAPMDIRGTPDSSRDRRHILVTLVMTAFSLSAIVIAAFTRGARFRGYSLGTAAVFVVFGGLSGYLARPMPGPTPGVGLVERVNIYASMLWIAVLGAVLWRPSGTGRQ